jgi:hypothetical protein
MLGARGRDILLQFLVEYGLVLVMALFFGFVIVSACEKQFLALTELPVEANYIYQEIGIYSTVVTVFSLLVSLPIISYFRHQSLQSSIKGVGGIANYNSFRRISTGVQIGISFLCIFCTVVLMKQLNTLRHGDIGFERENRIVYQHYNWEELEGIASFLIQCPEVDTAFISPSPIYPTTREGTMTLRPHHFPELTSPLKLSVQ